MSDECSKCHRTMSTDEGCDPTDLCRNCAQEEVGILRQRIAELEAVIREVRPELHALREQNARLERAEAAHAALAQKDA